MKTPHVLALAMAGATNLAIAQPMAVDEPSLWVTDDVDRMVYQISFDGSTVLSSFRSTITTGNGTVGVPGSGIAIDPTNDTLWIARELSGQLVNYSRDGVQLGFIPFQDLYGDVRPEGIDVDATDGTLWVVDDPEDPAQADRIYHLRRDGSLIDSFLTTAFSPSASSQQGIAVDPFNGSLWISDNATNTVYNVDNQGDLLFSFRTRDLDPPAFNPQGITVDAETDTLWITSRFTQRIYNVAVHSDGVSTISSFPSTDYDANATSPTGIAYDGRTGESFERFIDLGAARGLTALTLHGSEFKLTDGARVVGDIAIGPRGKGTFEDGVVSGDIVVDPRARIDKFDNMQFAGDRVVKSVATADADVLDASYQFRSLQPTQRFGKIKRSLTISGGPGVHVVSVEKIELKSSALTIAGEPDAEFIINVDKEVKLDEGARIRLSGVEPRQVVFNIGPSGAEFKKGSTARGIFLSVDGAIKLDERSKLFGAAISGDEIELKVGSTIHGVP